MLGLQRGIKPASQLTLHHSHNSPCNRTLPEVMFAATTQRTTHTTTVMHMHALSRGQTIQGQPPKNLFEVIVPSQFPKLALSRCNRPAAILNMSRATPHHGRRHRVHKITTIAV